MDINDIYQFVQFIANKYQSGYLPPGQFNPLFNWSQRAYFNKLIEDIQGWDANRKRIKLPMGNAEQAIEKIAPFIVRAVITVNGQGELAKPAGLRKVLAFRTSDNKQRIWRTESDRVFSHLSSVIDPPAASPTFTEYAEYYQVYPVDIGNVNVDYIKQPTDALWNYTIVSNRPVYTSVGSIQPLWDDTQYPEIVSRMFREYGISVASAEMLSYFNAINQNGQ